MPWLPLDELLKHTLQGLIGAHSVISANTKCGSPINIKPPPKLLHWLLSLIQTVDITFKVLNCTAVEQIRQFLPRIKSALGKDSAENSLLLLHTLVWGSWCMTEMAFLFNNSRHFVEFFPKNYVQLLAAIWYTSYSNMVLIPAHLSCSFILGFIFALLL